MGATVIDLDKKRIERQVIEGGYYVKARKIKNSEIYYAPPHIRETWDWLLREANFADKGNVQRGQCLRSYKDIQEGLSWKVGFRKESYTLKQIEKSVTWLKSRGMITVKRVKAGLVVSICKYEEYQDVKNYLTREGEREGNGQSHERGMVGLDNSPESLEKGSTCETTRGEWSEPREGEREGNLINYNERDNIYTASPDAVHTPPENSEKKDSHQKPTERASTLADPPQQEEPTYTTIKGHVLKGKRLETFERFWDAFGYKRGKAEAAESWFKIPVLTEGIVLQIVDAAKKESSIRPELKSKGVTPKMAQGWLSGRRWEDEDYQSAPEPQDEVVFKVDPDECEYKEPTK